MSHLKIYAVYSCLAEEESVSKTSLCINMELY